MAEGCHDRSRLLTAGTKLDLSELLLGTGRGVAESRACSAERRTAVLDQCAAFDGGKLPERWRKPVMTEASC